MTHIKNRWYLPFLFVLASCSSDELGPSRDVAYYMEHDDERKTVIEKCGNDPGRYQFHANCTNAYQARDSKMFAPGSGRAIPPPPPVAWLLMGPKEQQQYRDMIRDMTQEEIDAYNEEHGLSGLELH